MARIRARSLFANGLFISASTGEGVDELLKSISAVASEHSRGITAVIPPQRGDLVALAYDRTTVLASEYDDNGNTVLTISANAFYREKFKDFQKD